MIRQIFIALFLLFYCFTNAQELVLGDIIGSSEKVLFSLDRVYDRPSGGYVIQYTETKSYREKVTYVGLVNEKAGFDVKIEKSFKDTSIPTYFNSIVDMNGKLYELFREVSKATKTAVIYGRELSYDNLKPIGKKVELNRFTSKKWYTTAMFRFVLSDDKKQLVVVANNLVKGNADKDIKVYDSNLKKIKEYTHVSNNKEPNYSPGRNAMHTVSPQGLDAYATTTFYTTSGNSFYVSSNSGVAEVTKSSNVDNYQKVIKATSFNSKKKALLNLKFVSNTDEELTIMGTYYNGEIETGKMSIMYSTGAENYMDYQNWFCTGVYVAVLDQKTLAVKEEKYLPLPEKFVSHYQQFYKGSIKGQGEVSLANTKLISQVINEVGNVVYTFEYNDLNLIKKYQVPESSLSFYVGQATVYDLNMNDCFIESWYRGALLTLEVSPKGEVLTSHIVHKQNDLYKKEIHTACLELGGGEYIYFFMDNVENEGLLGNTDIQKVKNNTKKTKLMMVNVKEGKVISRKVALQDEEDIQPLLKRSSTTNLMLLNYQKAKKIQLALVK